MMNKIAVVLFAGLLCVSAGHAVADTSGKVGDVSIDNRYIVIDGNRYRLAELLEIDLPEDNSVDGIYVGATVRLEFSGERVSRITVVK